MQVLRLPGSPFSWVSVYLSESIVLSLVISEGGSVLTPFSLLVAGWSGPPQPHSSIDELSLPSPPARANWLPLPHQLSPAFDTNWYGVPPLILPLPPRPLFLGHLLDEEGEAGPAATRLSAIWSPSPPSSLRHQEKSVMNPWPPPKGVGWG